MGRCVGNGEESHWCSCLSSARISQGQGEEDVTGRLTSKPSAMAKRGTTATAHVILALVICGVWAACAQNTKLGQDVFLDVVVSNRFFRDAAARPTLSIRTREAVNLDCLVYDAGNRLIAHRTGGATTDRFTLALEHLPPVSKGIYLFALVASDQAHKRVGMYPQSPGGGEIIKVRESGLAAEKRLITYVLPRAACVRVRAGFREGLYLQPVISGEAQPAGKHTVAWDGTGQGGLFTNLYQHPSVQVSILAVSLPVSVLVGEDPAHWLPDGQVTPEAKALPAHLAELTSTPWETADEEKQPSFLIAADYSLKLETKDEPATRTVEIQADCVSVNRSRLFNKRFELMLFLDTTFLAEDEHSQLPFSYRMSTRGLAPGRHILTANVIDSDGIVGTVSKELLISHP